MTQNKIYKVAALGLSEIELRFIKIMLALTVHATTLREHGRYELTEDLSAANIVLLDAEQDEAMNRWRTLAEKKSPPILLLITAAKHVPYTQYHFPRPFGPSKVLAMLDKIAMDQLEKTVEKEVFSGEGKSAQRQPPAQDGNAIRYRALVVDDSPTVRKQLVLELACFNIKVDTAETGEQGLEMLRNSHYDIIFLDVVLPGTDGYQVCKTLRKEQETKRTPVIMLTSKSSPFDKVRGSLSGCSSYLTKPVDYDNFFKVLEGFLAHIKSDLAESKKRA